MSVTGSAGIAAPLCSAAAIARDTNSALANGRAASWMRTMSGLRALERFQAGAHRSLPGRAAERPAKKNIDVCRTRPAIEVEIVGVNNRLYAADVGMFYEHGQRPAQHGFATDLPELLGQIAAGARSASCGHDDGGDVRHAVGAPE